jgi:two-component system, NarL family, invasion response regulator UvrY
MYLSATVAQTLAQFDPKINAPASNVLSAREFEVLRLLVQGQSIRDIAHSMGLNSKTIYRHRAMIRQKLGADSAIELFAIADGPGATR